MYNECRHIMPTGAKCHSPALQDKAFCYYHANLRRATAPRSKSDDPPPAIPALEDNGAVQIALTQVLGELNSSRIDQRRAGLLLYGLQIAAQLTARPIAPYHDPVRSICYEDDGSPLAIEESVCEPPADCRNCPKQNSAKSTKKKKRMTRTG